MSEAPLDEQQRLLICTDLDRTLVPNGEAPESPEARPAIRALAALPGVTLAYVSGRDFGLVEEAISAFELPEPAYVVGDVGTSIHDSTGNRLAAWDRRLGACWPDGGARRLRALVGKRRGLRPQEEAKQGRFKLSYYVDLELAVEPLLTELRTSLPPDLARVRLVYSIDEQARVGLLDVLPEGGGKLAAIEFLVAMTGHAPGQTVFCGDSGNDLDVFLSGLPSVMVANGDEATREAARRGLPRGADSLYFATGDFQGMNGNYAAGMLEGIAHYHPWVSAWLSTYRSAGRADTAGRRGDNP